MENRSEPEEAAERGIFRMELPFFCLTYTEEVSALDLLRRLEVEPSASSMLGRTEAESLIDFESEGSLLRAGGLDNWSFCFETWGTLGAGEYGLSRMSRGTQTLSYTNGGNGLDLVQRWVDGRPVEVFEVLVAGSLRAQAETPLWDAAQLHLSEPAESETSLAGCVAALRAVHDHVGGHITPELIAQPLRSSWVPATPAMRVQHLDPPPPVHRPAAPHGLGPRLHGL
ncbi:DUF6461 domain-containing protein [Streptomyces sp. FR-108]|uniref:DUF6461 domain-containing protein n=1 Tax=Streptomyces sp. FR-108 TaxID=3416665 RepID=UPI003CED18BA